MNGGDFNPKPKPVAVPTEAARDSARGSCRWGLPAPADLTFKQTTFDQTFLLNPAGVDARMYRQFHLDRRYTGDVSRNLWQIPVLWTPLRFQVGPEVNVFKRAVNT